MSLRMMVSSTVTELLPERQVVVDVLNGYRIVSPVGVKPIQSPAVGMSSFLNTTKLAKECDAYLLILGRKFGFQTPDGRSATEVEFDAAYHDDPTKVLVFHKARGPVEPAQQLFIDRVSAYTSGYFLQQFTQLADLKVKVQSTVDTFLEERARRHAQLSYVDHFLLIAIQNLPAPIGKPTYAMLSDYIEFEYELGRDVFVIHVAHSEIYRDFWGSLSTMEQRFERFRRERE